MVEHAVFEAEIARLSAHPLHPLTALDEFGVADAEMKAARPLMTNRDAGLAQKLRGERRPFVGRTPGPALIMRRAVALALDPNETEIAS